MPDGYINKSGAWRYRFPIFCSCRSLARRSLLCVDFSCNRHLEQVDCSGISVEVLWEHAIYFQLEQVAKWFPLCDKILCNKILSRADCEIFRAQKQNFMHKTSHLLDLPPHCAPFAPHYALKKYFMHWNSRFCRVRFELCHKTLQRPHLAMNYVIKKCLLHRNFARCHDAVERCKKNLHYCMNSCILFKNFAPASEFHVYCIIFRANRFDFWPISFISGHFFWNSQIDPASNNVTLNEIHYKQTASGRTVRHKWPAYYAKAVSPRK